MRLLDTYATNTGSTIDKPFIYEKYCPLPFDKYITLQAETPYDSRNYHYWSEVVEYISPFLQRENIHIIQIGLESEKKIDGCYHLQGKTNINQAAYIIKKSMLHFGADSMAVHFASHYDIPIVSLYSISNPSVAGPHFGDKNKHVLFKGYERIGNKKPSYSQVELPKSINTISPEEIAKSILSLLNIKHSNIPKSIFFGDDYNKKLIESVPNQVIENIAQFGIDSLIMRMDYEFNEQMLAEQLKRNRCSIITNKKINFDLLNALKPNIDQIIYDIDEQYDIDFAKNLKKLARPFILSTSLSEDFVNSLKLNFLDIAQVIRVPKATKESLNFESKNLNNYYYKSSKYTLSKGLVFNSKAAYKANLPFDNKLTKVIDTPEFWEESKYFYILELTKE